MSCGCGLSLSEQLGRCRSVADDHGRRGVFGGERAVFFREVHGVSDRILLVFEVLVLRQVMVAVEVILRVVCLIRLFVPPRSSFLSPAAAVLVALGTVTASPAEFVLLATIQL